MDKCEKCFMKKSVIVMRMSARNAVMVLACLLLLKAVTVPAEMMTNRVAQSLCVIIVLGDMVFSWLREW